MVAKKSEYQKEYRSSLVRKHQDTYLANLQLRHERRDREFLHTPICWGADDEPTSSDSSDECTSALPSTAACLPVQPKQQYQSLAEILADAKEKDEAHRLKRRSELIDYSGVPDISKLALTHSDNVNNSASTALKICDNNDNIEFECTDDKHVGDKSFSLYDMLAEENKRLNERIAKQNTGWTEAVKDGGTENAKAMDECRVNLQGTDKGNYEKELPSNLRENAHSKRQKEKVRKTRKHCRPVASSKESVLKGKSFCHPKGSIQISTASCKSSGRIRRPDRQAEIPKAKPRPESRETLESRPPFVAYGAGDVENNLATHRTHNVMALSDVYAPALKAKTRREEERRQLRKRRELVKSADARLLNKLAEVTSPRDQTDWRSEYQKQYHAYQPRDYERAVSSRAVVRHSVPIAAIHRGGCLVVHVD